MRDPRDGSDDESERNDMVEDEEDDDGGGDDDDSEDGSEESDVGSSDLEGPLVTPAIQVSIRQAGV